jgi:hypothetical protein
MASGYCANSIPSLSQDILRDPVLSVAALAGGFPNSDWRVHRIMMFVFWRNPIYWRPNGTAIYACFPNSDFDAGFLEVHGWLWVMCGIVSFNFGFVGTCSAQDCHCRCHILYHLRVLN